MNNTASLRRIEAGRLADAFPARRVATILTTVILAVLIISVRPFNPAGATEPGGDVVNQLGFGALGALSIAALMTYVDRRLIVALISPWWLIALAFFVASIMHATDPASAGRAAAFTLIGMLGVFAVLTLPRDADSFSSALSTAGLLTLALCFVGLALFPTIAIHTADSAEPEHAGFWRGVFAHKNVAGPVMACLSFAGLYLWRRGWRWRGALLFASAVLFMANTGSKTTVGLVPLTVMLVMGPSLIGARALAPVLFVTAFVLTALGTLGIVFIEPLKQLAADWFPGLTYTGRTYLWSFTGEYIMQRPWTGYGYESFWGDYVKAQELPFDKEWDIRGIVHSHSGYMDIAVLMGLPAVFACLIAFVVAPLSDFMRVPMRRENVLLADLFLMLLLFASLNSFLESFYFRRVDPVWVFFLIGAFGLRLVARFPVRGHAAR